MKLSDLIQDAQTLMRKHGDLEIFIMLKDDICMEICGLGKSTITAPDGTLLDAAVLCEETVDEMRERGVGVDPWLEVVK